MAQPNFATYDPAKVSLVYGAVIITGFAQDTMIRVERNTPTWSDTAGSDGFVTRAKSLDKRGTITVTLDMSSPTNDALSALFYADETTGKGAQTIMMRDASGTTVASGASAWIVQPAAIEFGAGVLGREWQFRVAILAMSPGGNN